MRFANKVVIVTGAGSGIGRAAALQFAREGAKVVCADIVRAEETARTIGGAAIECVMDAGSEPDVRSAVALAVERFGGVDVMFANAGISGGRAGLFDTDVALLTEVMRVNLIGPFLAIKHAAPEIARRGGGAIVVTGSIAGIRASAGPPAYSASKAALINLAQLSAQHLVHDSIRVNAVCPGLTETGMTKPIFDQARANRSGDSIDPLPAMHRGARAEEVAEVACFLASDAASYVNGQALIVDGGLVSSHPFMRAGDAAAG